MRTLKKTLCLVLAVVLCFGLVGTAFAGNLDKYSDAKDIDANYVEAVDLFTGLGILEGDAGAFAPNGTFTRAAVAKIAAYMTLGASAKNLAGSTAKYTDVAKDFWAMPFIAYCDSIGLIEGDGNGLFRPNDAITGFEGAVIFLRCAGFGVKGEYSGSDWTLNASKDALKYGVYNANLIADGANSGNALQRDQAVQMAFNALTKVPTVKWSTIYSDYVANTSNSTIGTTLEKTYLMGNFDCTKKNYTDDYGFYGHDYKTAKGKALSDFYKDGAVIGKLVGPMKASAIKAEYSVDDIISGYTYIYNGRTETLGLTATQLLNTDIPAGVTLYLMDEKDSAGYGTDGKVDKVVMVEEYIYPVTAVDKTAKTATVNGWTIKNTLELAKGDLVICVPNFDTQEFVSIAKAAVGLTGKVTATASTYIRVDGKNVNLARVIGGESITLGNSYDFYLDSTGAILYVANETVDEAALNYCYVTNSAFAPASALTGVAGYARAAMVKVDGSSSVVNVYTFTKSGDTYYVAPDGTETKVTSNTTIPATYYSYVEKSDGTYQFTALKSAKAVGLTNGQTAIVANKSASVTGTGVAANSLATSATVLSVGNEGKVTTTTGYANWTSKTYTAAISASGTQTYILYTKGAISSIITGIYVFSGSAAVTPVYAVYTGTAGELTSDGQAYKFYVNGEIKDYIVGTTPDASKIYTLTATSETEASIVEVGSGDVKTGVVALLDTGYFTITGAETTVLPFASTCKVYDVTTAGGGAESKLVGPTKTAYGETVKYVVSGGQVQVIYITAAGADKP